MEIIYSTRLAEIRREKRFLEGKLKVKIEIEGRKIKIEGEPLNEYLATIVFDAINLGFSASTASLLTDEEFSFEKINIKSFTRRKDLDVIRGRVIGTRGKTKNTVEQISGCSIKIQENIVGIIGPAENMQYAITAITNIVKGTKQSNVYKYLEKINTEKRKERKGLK